ncbi:hypothetical protein CUC15_15415 [Oceanobacillus zhaokaii]|uniref:DUF3995 domain-containing protein n=1 Tax=Oceanobacillus zhaokaii TaxID=2052660 RepID=A0A345PJQ7_9BACI|nr:DUF3995 domain-containing protein [Oceanobacillus zhaokaii]AXI10237.1 hypothetical protein CUC15_15415 [Oceanobacillus zhaokaii]
METKINKYYVYMGIIWTILFAGMSFYWALGGMIGVRSLGGAIYEQALDPEPAFVTIVWMTAFIKLFGALLLFMLLVKWRDSWMRMILYFMIKVSGALLFLYGLFNFITIILSTIDLLDFQLDGYAIFWRLLFWEPYWMIGGLIYFFTIKIAK